MVLRRTILRNGEVIKYMIDFTQCDVEPLRVYDGANGKKICVIYNNERYMLKFPATCKKQSCDAFYSNGCLNEHIAVQFMEH